VTQGPLAFLELGTVYCQCLRAGRETWSRAVDFDIGELVRFRKRRVGCVGLGALLKRRECKDLASTDCAHKCGARWDVTCSTMYPLGRKIRRTPQVADSRRLAGVSTIAQ